MDLNGIAKKAAVSATATVTALAGGVGSACSFGAGVRPRSSRTSIPRWRYAPLRLDRVQ